MKVSFAGQPAPLTVTRLLLAAMAGVMMMRDTCWVRLPVPSVVVPSMNVTVSPAGGGGLTVAVKVTLSFRRLGLAELTTVVVVLVMPWLTIWTTLPLLARKWGSPPGSLAGIGRAPA